MAKKPMTNSREAAAAARIVRMETVLADALALVEERVAKIKELKTGEPRNVKDLNAELSALNTTRMTLIKAEEAYHDTYGPTSDDVTVDYDAVRAAIGRRLDRIRDAADAGELCERVDGDGADCASVLL